MANDNDTSVKPPVRVRVNNVLKTWAGADTIVPATQFVCTLWARFNQTAPCDKALPDLIRKLRKEFDGEVTIKLKPADLQEKGGASTINKLVEFIAGLGQ